MSTNTSAKSTTTDTGAQNTGTGATPSTEPTVFTPITTQDGLDHIIKSRLERERSKFADYEDLKTKAVKFDELQEANKTELQKLTERAEKAEQSAKAYQQQAQLTAWKEEISKETGVPAVVLAGTTKEELQAHAQALAPLLAQQQQTPSHPRTVIRSEGEKDLPLNGEGIEDALRNALGID